MKRCRYSKREVLDKTRTAIRLFIQKQIEPFTAMLDESFVWVGDYEPLYMKGIPSFLESVKEKLAQPGVQITDEEYALIVHERSIWVTYGRFVVTMNGDSAKIHFTFVWKQQDGDLKLLHANANHAKKMPVPAAQSRIFEKHAEPGPEPYQENQQKLALRSLDGTIHYLLCEDIIYIKADNMVCELFTKNNSIRCRISLKELSFPPFVRIHKSYLCNLAYIRSIRRYRATLPDGTELPIGKEWYMDIKHLLKEESALGAQTDLS